MKKSLFILSIAAALASCSSDTVVEKNPAQPVSANSLMIYPEIGNITRGTVWDNTNFTKFKLTTTGKFQTDATTVNATDGATLNTTVEKQAGGLWAIMSGENTQEYYWPSKSATSDFTAWAPTDVNAGTSETYTASTTIDEQKDIVVAFNSGSATDFEAGVPLKFRHILSQIVIKADNAAKNKIQIKVKNVRLNNIKGTGTWSLPTSSTVESLANPWTGAPTGEVNYLTGVGTTTPIELDGSAKDLTGESPLLLIPQQLGTADIAAGTGQYLSVLVQIQNKNETDDTKKAIFPKINVGETTGETIANQNFAWAAVDINTNWEPGKKYIYTLHFTENGYGKVDGDTGDGGSEPGVDPGDDVVDAPVKLILDVEVIDWVDVNEEHNM